MGGNGSTAVLATVSGAAASIPGLIVRPNAFASDISWLPTLWDAACRAGVATPVARLTPIEPARGLVRMWTAGLPPEPLDEVRP